MRVVPDGSETTSVLSAVVNRHVSVGRKMEEPSRSEQHRSRKLLLAAVLLALVLAFALSKTKQNDGVAKEAGVVNFVSIEPGQVAGSYIIPRTNKEVLFNATRTVDSQEIVSIANGSAVLFRWDAGNATDGGTLTILGQWFAKHNMTDSNADAMLAKLLGTEEMQALPLLLQHVYEQGKVTGSQYPQLLRYYGFARAAHQHAQNRRQLFALSHEHEYEWGKYPWLSPTSQVGATGLEHGALSRVHGALPGNGELPGTSKACATDPPCARAEGGIPCDKVQVREWPSKRGYQCKTADTKLTVLDSKGVNGYGPTTGHSVCAGMCGPACCCWKWACGDCCAHPACMFHDLVSCVNTFSVSCTTANWGGFKCWGDFPEMIDWSATTQTPKAPRCIVCSRQRMACLAPCMLLALIPIAIIHIAVQCFVGRTRRVQQRASAFGVHLAGQLAEQVAAAVQRVIRDAFSIEPVLTIVLLRTTTMLVTTSHT